MAETEMPAAPAATRRAGAERTRELILETAGRLFAEKGYKGASIADIADQAGLAPGTIYIHFENKEDLLAQVIRGGKASELAVSSEEVAEVPLTELFGLIARLMLQETRKRAAFMTSLAQDARDLPATRRDFYEQTMLGPVQDLTRILAERPETAHLDEATRRIIAHGVFSATVFLVIEQIALGGQEIHRVELDDIPDVLGRLFAGGLGAFAPD